MSIRQLNIFSSKTFGIFFGLMLATLLTACNSEQKAEVADAELKIEADRELIKAEEKSASIKELQACFSEKYFLSEDLEVSTRIVAQKVRGMCSDAFQHVRAVKFNYELVPEIMAPSQEMINGEIALTMLFVERSREGMKKFLQGHQSIPANGGLPHGHPPVDYADDQLQGSLI
jgi:hypothetical protein